MIQWVEEGLMDATHVEINGEVFELKEDGKVKRSVDFGWIDILVERSVDGYVDVDKWANIPQEAFPLLGIKCLRKMKPTPIQFKATFVSYDGNWRLLDCLEDGFAHQNFKKKKFRCIEILEDEE
jgi:hypothetical protein